MSNYITTDWLNLRTEPLVKKGNVISIMPPDTVVQKLDDAPVNGWMKIKFIQGRTLIQGYASARYLSLTDAAFTQPSEVVPQIAEAHLKTNGLVQRNSVEGRASPLNEPGLVKLDLKYIAGIEERRHAVHQVIQYLDVEHSARYAPTAKNTFCNIYATDLAYCLGLYVPRVWWTSDALASVLRGEKPEAIYGQTVGEMNANALANWFESYGAAFKWSRMLHITELQEAVNRGRLGIIVAQRIDLSRSGHIVAVVPERPGLSALRSGDQVLSPLQSQAGVKNKKYFTNRNWWEIPNRFRKFGFWVWEG